MRIPHDDALLRDMIADAMKYSENLRRRRAKGIMRMEPPVVLAFYDREIMENDRKIMIMKAGKKRRNR